MLSLVVADTTEGLMRCEVVAGNWAGGDGPSGYLFNDRTVAYFGSEIAIRLGLRR